MVCQHFGIDTSDYSFPYVTGWSRGKELPELKASLECISKTSAKMIVDIEKSSLEKRIVKREEKLEVDCTRDISEI